MPEPIIVTIKCLNDGRSYFLYQFDTSSSKRYIMSVVYRLIRQKYPHNYYTQSFEIFTNKYLESYEY